jgi:hypothetical protein
MAPDALPAAAALDAWRATMANPLRRRWCRRYLAWIGAERLATMGYDCAALETELAAAPRSLRHLGSDFMRLGFGWLDQRLDLEPRLRGLLPAGRGAAAVGPNLARHHRGRATGA